MKRLVCILIVIIAALMPLSALAAEGDALIARQGLNGFDDQITAICGSGDILWMLGGNGIYTWDCSSAAMQSWPFDEALLASQTAYDEARQTAVYQSIAAWFAWNGAPYALIQSRTDEGIIDLWLARVQLDGTVRFEAVGHVDWQPLDVTGQVTIFSCVEIGDTLCAMAGDHADMAELALIPLDGSPTVLTGVRGREVCAYENGVAVLRDDWNTDESTITAYDISSGITRRLYGQNVELGIGGIAQESGTARILTCTGGHVTAIDPNSGAAERIAPISVAIDQMGGAPAVTLNAGLYAAASHDGVTLRRVVGRSGESVVLKVDELGWSPALSDGALDMEQQNPDVSVTFTYKTDVMRMLLTHSGEIDIVVGYSLYDGGDTALRDVLSRGYAAELNSTVLKDYVDCMYPALRDLFMRNGHVVAVPLDAHASGLSINLDQLTALGLTADDLPVREQNCLSL